MTEQELFDQIVTHLRKQGHKAQTVDEDGDEMCRYRMKNGDKCAVGCVITDKEYASDMEGKNVDTLVKEGLFPRRLLPHAEFLMDMQRIHDGGLIEEWEMSFRYMAETHKLTLPPKE